MMANIILINKEQEGVLKSQIRSRHTSSKTYNLWIEYSTGLSPITGWFCTCKSGVRVVGCCAHIASVLWYLGFERHQSAKKGPKIHNTWIFFQMLQLKFGMQTGTPQNKVIENEMSKCVSIRSDKNDELFKTTKSNFGPN